MSDALESLTRELESVAQRLRSGELEPGAAARLVERCAELAGAIGMELDSRGRAAQEPEGQERLL